MIEFLVSLLVLSIIIYVIYLILGQIQLPAQVKTIVYLVVGVVLLIWFLNYTGILHGNLFLTSKP